MSGRLGSPFARQCRRLRERGAVAVEFALVLPLLAMLLMGVITGGVAFTNSIGLANAVREGARFGATGDLDSGTWAADVTLRTRQTQFDDDLTNPATTVCWKVIGPGAIPWDCDPGVAPAPPEPPDASLPTPPAGTCVVVVAASRPYRLNFIFGSFDSELVRQSVARYERSCS
jgi:Flp pilus assembly protein TadG